MGREKIPAVHVLHRPTENVYESVGGELLWKALARIGMPQEILAIIRQFYDGMRTRVRIARCRVLGVVGSQTRATARLCGLTFAFQPVF